MSIDILVRGSLVYTGDEVIRDGYIYIRAGRVESVGESPVPEDLTYAALILGGEGRIILPGLAMIADLLAYPIRLYKPSMAKRLEYYESMGVQALATVAKPAVYEAHMSGVTTLIIEAHTPEPIQKLAETVGGIYGMATPACLDTSPHTAGLVASTRIADDSCPGEGLRYTRDILALESRLTYTLSGVSHAYERSSKLRSILGLSPQGIKEGSIAEVAVYNSSRPPGMLLDYTGEEIVKRIYESGIQVETLITGDHVLVDGGEHLYIVEKDFKEARRIGTRLLGRYPQN